MTTMGDSRKYPCYTMGDILEFRGRGGGGLDCNSEGMGEGVMQFGISKGKGGKNVDATRGRVWIFSGITQWLQI